MTAGAREEQDLLGAREVPEDAYWGIHTLRAVENFSVSGITLGRRPDLIWALASVKRAAAEANRRLGALDPDTATAIATAAAEIVAGSLHDEFVVDVVQGGAGTSANMNANEVIANRALELLGEPRGRYLVVSPHDHVNLNQSTNDVFPSAARLALVRSSRRLVDSLDSLAAALRDRGEALGGVGIVGRTQLQDAVPLTLGRQLHAYATIVDQLAGRMRRLNAEPIPVNLGGTAIGTGVAAHPDFGPVACERLHDLTGLPVLPADDLVAATQDTTPVTRRSAVTRDLAVQLGKLASDLRLMASGPEAGFRDIALPPMQAGSSLMPGKVNPVIPEMVNQVVFRVIGADLCVTMGAEGGQLQLNAFWPVMTDALLQSINELSRAVDLLVERCVAGIAAADDQGGQRWWTSTAIATGLVPKLGYGAASSVVSEATAAGIPVGELVVDRRLVTAQELRDLMAAAIGGDERKRQRVEEPQEAEPR